MRPARTPTLAHCSSRASELAAPLAIALFLVLAPLHTSAAEERPVSARKAFATTALEAGAVRAATLIVVGRIVHIKEVRSPGGGRGRQLVRVDVVEVLLGYTPKSREISVMVLGQRPTLNPDRPSVPYFDKPGRALFVLFLGRQERQFAFRLQTIFDGKGSVGRERIAVAKAVARLSTVADPEEKAKRTLGALLAMTKGAGSWTKTFAAREMNYLAGVHPAVFDVRNRARLQRIPTVSLSADQRFWFKRLFKTLAKSKAAAATSTPAKAREQAENDPWRTTFLAAPDAEQQKAMLQRLLTGGPEARERHASWAWREVEPSLKIWFARAVAATGVGHEGRRLRRMYGGEEDQDVRAAIIRAVGLTGDDSDVAWLTQRSSNFRLRRPALLALARVGSPNAQEALRRAQAAAEGAHETDLAKWIAHLRSPAFKAAERNAGR